MNTGILIVDADALTRGSVTKKLKQRGCTVIEARDLVQANQILRDYTIDVAVIDLVSLQKEALVVLQMLKHVQPRAEAILLTAPEHIALSIKGMKLGAFDDLMVPVDVEALLAKICAALEKIREEGRKLTVAIPEG